MKPWYIELTDEIEDIYISLARSCFGVMLVLTAPVWIPIRLIVRKMKEKRR